MTVIGYARVSTTDQDLSIQEAALKAAGCQVIRAEKRSGATTEGREALRAVLEFLHAGDVLMVTRIDRLARSIGDLQDIVCTVRARGAVLEHRRPSGHRSHRSGARRGPEGHRAAHRLLATTLGATVPPVPPISPAS
jgi:Resolvase, N terminal domain